MWFWSAYSIPGKRHEIDGALLERPESRASSIVDRTKAVYAPGAWASDWRIVACRSSTCRAGSSRCSARTGRSWLFTTVRSTILPRWLASWLSALGHVFRTHCDTEVIVHAWEAWGGSDASKFRGMFAFALWDPTVKCCFWHATVSGSSRSIIRRWTTAV